MKSTGATPIGMIGLGIMGGAIDGALLDAGHEVSGCDLAEAALARFEERGGRRCSDATAVARESRIVITSLPSSESLMATTGAMAMFAPRDGSRRILIETSTLPLASKQAAAKLLEEAGIVVLDCPIGGTGATQKSRGWTIYCSGDEAAWVELRQALRVLADKTPHVGAFGCGTRMKIAANHLVAIYNVAYGESVNLVRKDTPAVSEVIAGVAGWNKDQ